MLPFPGWAWTEQMEDAMATAKEEVRKLLDALPDDSSFEDIQYHIYVSWRSSGMQRRARLTKRCSGRARGARRSTLSVRRAR